MEKKREIVEDAKSKVREERIRIKGRTVIYANKVCEKGEGGRNDCGI